MTSECCVKDWNEVVSRGGTWWR